MKKLKKTHKLINKDFDENLIRIKQKSTVKKDIKIFLKKYFNKKKLIRNDHMDILSSWYLQIMNIKLNKYIKINKLKIIFIRTKLISKVYN